MNNIILSFRKSTKYLSYPFMMLAVFLMIGGIFQLTPFYSRTSISAIWDEYAPLITGALFTGFITYYTCKNAKKSITATTTYLIFDLAYYCFSGHHYGLIFTILTAFIVAKIYKEYQLLYSYLITLISGLIFSIVLGFLYPFITDTLMSICTFFSNKGALFGALNNLYAILFGDDLGAMFYNKDYTGSMLIGDEIRTGVFSIFRANTKEPAGIVSEYLAGKYFSNIFLPIGAYICIFSRLDKDESNALTLCAILSIIFGNNLLFCAFLFLFNPFVYLGYLLVVFIGYYVCGLLDIRAGYLQNGSIIEFAKYGDKWIYFILTGIVLAVLCYFVTRLLIARLDIRTTRILPKEIKKLVYALGGEDNIERIQGDKLYVKNPNLINILKIDCDIHENEVTMIYDELEMLKEYF